MSWANPLRVNSSLRQNSPFYLWEPNHTAHNSELLVILHLERDDSHGVVANFPHSEECFYLIAAAHKCYAYLDDSKTQVLLVEHNDLVVIRTLIQDVPRHGIGPTKEGGGKGTFIENGKEDFDWTRTWTPDLCNTVPALSHLSCQTIWMVAVPNSQLVFAWVGAPVRSI